MAKKRIIKNLVITGVVLAVVGTGVGLGVHYKDEIKDGWNRLWGIEQIVPDTPTDDPEQPLTQSVSFVIRGEIQNDIVITGSMATAPAMPIRAGYTFTGWTIDGYNEVYVDKVPINNATTFYAMFEKSTSASNFEFENGKLVKYLGEDSKVVIPATYSLGEVEQVYTEWSDYNTLYAFWNENQDKMPLTVRTYDDDTGEEVAYELTTDRTSIQALRNLSWSQPLFADVPTQRYIDGTDIEVTSIGASAFKGINKMQEITIARTVKEIGSNAFYDCTGLKRVDIPNGVEIIGDKAFFTGSGDYPETITIASSVKSIGSNIVGALNSADIILLGEEVPQIKFDTFNIYSTIYVPDEELVAYLVADNFCNQKDQIKAYSEYEEA